MRTESYTVKSVRVDSDNPNRHSIYDKYARDKESKRFYNSAEWKKCRGLRLIIDNYLCQECLKQKKITPANTVHHIIELRDDPSKGLELDNLVSVCPSCHSSIHAKGNERERNIPIARG